MKNRSRRAVIGRAIQPFANRISRLLAYLKGPSGELFSVQPLESRQYLTSATLTGSAGANQVWDVRVNPNDSSQVQVFAHAQPLDSETPGYAYDRHDVTSITINSDTGNDTLIVDFTYGTPLDGSFAFNGSAGNNSVQLIGRSNLLASYQPSTQTANSGTITTSFQVLSFSSVATVAASGFQELSAPVSTPGANYTFTGSTGYTDAKLQVQMSALAATTAALPANTYLNGAAGVGATLTESPGTAALSIDGVSVTAGDRVLVKNEASASRNGLYVVTNAGGTSAWVLTRDTSMDQSGEFVSALVVVSSGGTNQNTAWCATVSGTISVGTTSIPFSQVQTQNNAGATILSLWHGSAYAAPLAYSNVSYVDVGALTSSSLTTHTMTSVTDSAVAAIRVRMAGSGTRTIAVAGTSLPLQIDTGTPTLDLATSSARATIVGDPTLNTVHIANGAILSLSTSSLAVSATTLNLDTGGTLDVNDATFTASTMNDSGGPSTGVISSTTSSTGYVGYSGCLPLLRSSYTGCYTSAKLKSVQRFDFNLDGVVNDLDLNIVLNYACCIGVNVGASNLHYSAYWFDGDLNNDGYVDDSEISTILNTSFPASSSHPAFSPSSATKTMTAQSPSVNQMQLSINYTQPTNGATFSAWIVFWGDGTFSNMTPSALVNSHQTGSALHVYTKTGVSTASLFGCINGGEWVSMGTVNTSSIPALPAVNADGPSTVAVNAPYPLRARKRIT
jgi:hypothetical protein